MSFAEAEFYRVRWSDQVLQEFERALATLLATKNHNDADARAIKARAAIEKAFEEAKVLDFDAFIPAENTLPDRSDLHVLGAAIKTHAFLIVTENIKHFPKEVLENYNLEAATSDEFIASTIDLDPGRAVAAVRKMRERLKNPALTPSELLLRMEANKLLETTLALRPHIQSL